MIKYQISKNPKRGKKREFQMRKTKLYKADDDITPDIFNTVDYQRLQLLPNKILKKKQ